MKRTERQHLKENELAQTLLAARGFFDSHKRALTVGALVGVVVLIAAGGMLVVRQRADAHANELLAEAMAAVNARVVPATPQPGTEPGALPPAATMGATGSFATEEAKLTAALPKLKAAADEYPNRQAGIAARYHLASTLAYLGRDQEAVQAFDEVLSRSKEGGLYSRVARLGKARAQAHAGQTDAAIATLKELAADSASDLPADGVLMELAQAYEVKGDKEEARKTYAQIVEQHPTSPFVPEAKRLAEREAAAPAS